MNYKYILTFIFVSILLIAFYQFKSSDTKSTPGQNKTQETNSYTKRAFINDKEIFLEIADTEELRRKGLSGRKSMPQNAGMLFVFDKEGYYPFWMKDTYFPLDFIWINNDKIVDITQNVPFSPGLETNNLPLYVSKVPADKVIEVNGGVAESLNSKVGDTVKIEE